MRASRPQLALRVLTLTESVLHPQHAPHAIVSCNSGAYAWHPSGEFYATRASILCNRKFFANSKMAVLSSTDLRFTGDTATRFFAGFHVHTRVSLIMYYYMWVYKVVHWHSHTARL
ncbi:hypothetical protein FKM82_009319 [Ascaphus truei]